jgi:hypothetical protein
MAKATALTIPLVYKMVGRLGTKNIAKLFWVLAIFSIISFSVLYIYQITSITAEEYGLQRKESQLIALRAENKELVTRIAKTNSLNNLAVLVEEDLGFEKVGTIKYIEVSDNQIVERGK